MADTMLDDGAEPSPARVATQRDFGRELTLARLRAGLTVREVARAVGLPASTTGDYFAGRHLPALSQPELLPALLRACGETELATLEEWVSALSRARRAPGKRPAAATAPYRGLETFEPEDAPWFFGRADLAEQLVTMATSARPAAGVPDASGLPLVVVGPSGSGKSSLLRAGLVPRWPAAPCVAEAQSAPSRNGGSAAHAPAGENGAGENGASENGAGENGASENGASENGASENGAGQNGPGGGTLALALFTPTASPLAALAAQLARLTASHGDAARDAAGIEQELRRDPASTGRLLAGLAEPPLVVVDQLESVFTECQDEADRAAFIGALCALAGAAVVVVALRADFYERVLRYPGLSRALQLRQIVVGPMCRTDVEAAIVGPARLAKLDVEDGLVEILLRDVAPRSPAGGGSSPGSTPGSTPGYGPGMLPLLSHALLATWQYSHGGRLTVAAYQASGGIRGAISQTAEQVYSALSDEQKDLARRLFLRLVHVADETPETRAALALSDLGPGAAGEAEVLARFVAQRLITMQADTAQITHDALLTAWPRLRGWIDASQESLRVARRIGQAAHVWQEAARDSGALLRGSQLAVARDWAADAGNRGSLGRVARDFLDGSIAQEAARQRAERRRTRRLRQLVGALTALVLATGGLTAYAFGQRQAADAARTSATIARDNAESRQVAVEADQVRPEDVSLAAQLSLAAYRIAATPQARSSLLDSTGTASAAELTDSPGVVQAVSLSADRKVLAVAAADGTLRLWDVATPGHVTPIGAALLRASSFPLYAAAFSPDGRILAAAGAQKTVTMWNVADPRHPVRIGPPLAGPTSTIYSVAFSPNGQLLAAGSYDKTVRLWDVANPLAPKLLATLAGFAGSVQAVAFSPAGTLLAAGSADKTVRLWNVTNPARPVPDGKPLTGPANIVNSVAFSPDGGLLAAGSEDNKVWLWRVAPSGVAKPAGPPLTGATDWVNAVAFSPDGTQLAAGSSDNSALVWNVATRALTATLPEPQPVTSVAWDGDGLLLTGQADGTVRTWSLPTPVLLTGSSANSVAYSPSGGLLAIGAQDLQLWDPVTRLELGTASAPAGTFVNDVAFAPRGDIIAASYGNGQVQLFNAAGGRLIPFGRPFRGSDKGMAESVMFSPDGNVLAEGGDDGKLRLWSVTDPANPALLATVNDAGIYPVLAVAFSPSGRTLAAASGDDLTRLWNVTSDSHPVLIGRPLAGPSSYAMSVAFSPNGRTLAVGSADRTVRLWNVTDLARPVRLGRPLTGPSGYVYAVAFSPDGTTLAAGATDGSVWLWNVSRPARPDLLATLTGPAGHVYSVAFSPSGGTLAAASADGTTRLWDTSVAAAATDVCDMAGQPLSAAAWHSYVPGLRYRVACATPLVPPSGSR
jgi:WD40 repeat protein